MEQNRCGDTLPSRYDLKEKTVPQPPLLWSETAAQLVRVDVCLFGKNPGPLGRWTPNPSFLHRRMEQLASDRPEPTAVFGQTRLRGRQRGGPGGISVQVRACDVGRCSSGFDTVLGLNNRRRAVRRRCSARHLAKAAPSAWELERGNQPVEQLWFAAIGLLRRSSHVRSWKPKCS
jgi:hypothetical protein